MEKTIDSHRILLLEPRIEMLLATLGLTGFSSALKQGRLILVPPQQTHSVRFKSHTSLEGAHLNAFQCQNVDYQGLRNLF